MSNENKVVLPEPVTWLIERSAFHVSPHGQDAESNEWLEEAHEPGEEGSFPVYTEQQVRALLAQAATAAAPANADSLATATGLPAQAVEQPRLTVRLTSFPEFNGKRNWTAMFQRTGEFDITIARGEYWNRVAYQAEEARFLLGERGTEPDIMAYGDDVHTPQEWSGEDADGVFAAIAAAKENEK